MGINHESEIRFYLLNYLQFYVQASGLEAPSLVLEVSVSYSFHVWTYKCTWSVVHDLQHERIDLSLQTLIN